MSKYRKFREIINQIFSAEYNKDNLKLYNFNKVYNDYLIHVKKFSNYFNYNLETDLLTKYLYINVSKNEIYEYLGLSGRNIANVRDKLLIPTFSNFKESGHYKPQNPIPKEYLISRTLAIIKSIDQAVSSESKNLRIEELSNIIIKYSFLKYHALRNGALSTILTLRKKEKDLDATINQNLAVLGYSPQLQNEGVRILSIDGGGSRGLLSLEIMKEIERVCQKPIYELFDLICGTSTGAFIACLIGLNHNTLDQCTKLYKNLSGNLFERNRFIGAGKLVWSHAYYDSDILARALKEQFGEKMMIQTAQNSSTPKVALISTIVNTPMPKAFVLRNYDHPLDTESLYPGTYNTSIWQACLASASAPGYFEACQFGPYILQDGGVLMNNPAAIAVHESKILWPGERIQCIVSLGNGRFNPFDKLLPSQQYSSLKAKLSKMAQFITDTEGTHTILSDLLPFNYYYRLNPRISKESHLDEKDPANLEILREDARRYIEKNGILMERLAKRLNAHRTLPSRAKDAFLNFKSSILTPT